MAAAAERGALTVAIVIENFTGAIGTVIFVAYLSALCGNPLHTATQYALLTALASTGRTLLSSGTGFVVDDHRLAGVLRRDGSGRAAVAGAAGVAAAARAFWPLVPLARVLHGERVRVRGSHKPHVEFSAAPHPDPLPASGEREAPAPTYDSRSPCAMILRITLGSAARSRSRRATHWQRCGSAQKVSDASAGTMAR